MTEQEQSGDHHEVKAVARESMNETQYDVEQAKQDMKQQYERETGETLPEHVLDNIQLLQAAGPTISDLEDAMENGRKMASKDYTAYQAAAIFLVAAVVFGLVGYGAGIALAGAYGMAIVAVVSAAFGFTVGALFT